MPEQTRDMVSFSIKGDAKISHSPGNFYFIEWAVYSLCEDNEIIIVI